MNEMQENTPWITEYIKHLVEKYFGPCGLVEDALKELRNLPKNLSKRLGCDEHFWQQYLSDPNNASQKLNAIEGPLITLAREPIVCRNNMTRTYAITST